MAQRAAATLPIRFIEGPGQDGRIVVEIEAFEDADVAAGCELDLVEGARVVGIVAVGRLWREALV